MARQTKNEGCGWLIFVILAIVALSRCTGQNEPAAPVASVYKAPPEQSAAPISIGPALAMFVIASKANCRSEAMPDADVVEPFGYGDEVETGTAQNGWLAVNRPTGGQCWIRAILLSEERPEYQSSAASTPPLRALETRQSESGPSCDGKRVCRQMDSCEEAYHYLNQCGVGRLDGDGDGVPCESIC